MSARYPLPHCILVCLLKSATGGGVRSATPRIHMVTFATEMYLDRLADSVLAKEMYAKRWGYTWNLFSEESLNCSRFRAHRWRGDYRYCKLQALSQVWKNVERLQNSTHSERDYLFWHDLDTHVMRPQTPLSFFIEAAGGAPVVFTDNALSLNNGVFFLEVSPAGRRFFKHWKKYCRTGEWPWADNGCMYEALLTLLGGERYTGRCSKYRKLHFDKDHPEPPTGPQLMRCFNEEMRTLGMGCCGGSRRLEGFRFLTGAEHLFNHHPCSELLTSREFVNESRALIQEHCFTEGMFMVHTKNVSYGEESMHRTTALTRGSQAEL